MAAKQSLEPSTPLTKQPLRDADVPSSLSDLLGASRERDVYLSTEQAARYTDRPSREAFIKWARRNNVPLRRPDAGRALVVKKADVDWALRKLR